MSFIKELKRRNVIRVAAAYAVVSWLLLQVVDTIGPMFELSNGFGRGVFLLLLIGLPIVLVLSWLFEFTEAGIKTQEDADHSDLKTSSSKLNAVLIVGMALAIVVLVVDNYVLVDSAAETETVVQLAEAEDSSLLGEINQAPELEKSIAVLPFENQSNDPDQEYFSDGLTDEMINNLSQLQDLLVIGRNSAFYFKGSDESLNAIGEQLKVSYILQGSVRKSGQQLRITAQLVNAQSGFTLWSDIFDRQLADVFAIQEEIAQQVTTSLSISLGVGEFDRPGMTKNVAAFDAFLLGNKVLKEVGMEPEQAIQHYQKAVALDADFAQGWNALGGAYYLDMMNSPNNETDDLLQLMAEADQQVNNLIPVAPEVRAVAARETAQQDKNWIAADRELQTLIAEFGARNPAVNAFYGGLLLRAGKGSEALPYLQRAVRLDPLESEYSQSLALSYFSLGREEEALLEVERGLSFDIAVRFQFLHAVRTVIAYADDNLDRAIAMLNMNSPGQPEYDIALPIVELLAAGETEEAIRRLRDIRESDAPPIVFAILQPVAALTGDTELSLSYMRLITENPTGQIGLWMAYSSPYFNEPEMKQRLRDSGLVDYWRVSGWNDFCQPIAGTEDDFECI
jgi:TolB-like protein